jgi:hypothetical protein
MDELTLDRDYRQGNSGVRVKIIKEWLCIHDINVVIDRDYTAATEEAVRKFQTRKGLNPTGIVNKQTYGRLLLPMREAMVPIPAGYRSLGTLTVAWARQHLRSWPHEVGGNNRGPWVRLYMKGSEGEDWAWCAGFACFMVGKAREAIPPTEPLFDFDFYCPRLGSNAKRVGRFIAGTGRAKPEKLGPGCLFLSRRSSGSWFHTGIVISADASTFRTIEGNSSDDSDQDQRGYEVCSKIRDYGSYDFIRV